MNEERVSPSNNVVPRIGIFSLRNLRKHVCRCWGYELENTIAQMDNAHIIAPEFAQARFSKWEPKARRVLERIFNCRYFSESKTVEQFETKNRFDLLFVFCQQSNDIRLLNAFKNWRKTCQVSACWLEELWLQHAIEFPKQMDLLRNFDFIFLSLRETAEYLRKKGLNAFHIAPGVDVARFSPYPTMPKRTVDFMAMGRRAPKTHGVMYDMARNGKIHYVYDTAPLREIGSPDEHRVMVANNVKRSRFFMVQKAKADEPGQTCGQDEVGGRYFEGCAGGAILVGESSSSLTMKEQFPWDDAVIHLPYDSDDLSFLFDKHFLPLDRMEAIHRENAIQSLLRHDWSYRWEFILNTVGMELPSGLNDRKEQLSEFADGIRSGIPSRTWMGKQAAISR